MAALTLRPYQEEAVKAVDYHICNSETNPCVVLPTGSGKSFVIASLIGLWKSGYAGLRVCVLAHRQELVEQNFMEFSTNFREFDVGIYAAGLGKRNTNNHVIFASIDSVYKKAGHFKAFDVIIVDEAHHIPPNGEGKYRTFINNCRRMNRNLRVIGVTATPYRMGCGQICHRDHILQEIVYDANVATLIDDGYLAPLRSKYNKDLLPDVSEVAKRGKNGDYVTKDLAKTMDKASLIEDTVKNALLIIQAEKRKSVIWFCVDVEHCSHVSSELRRYGIHAPSITAKTLPEDRKRYIEAFRRGSIQHLTNVNVLTEGFNVKHVDCIVLLRPTLSKGLYSQMVGRGLRIHPNKEDCLVLDYAGCILEHGPIDLLEGKEVKIQICDQCGDAFSFAVRKCPNCGWEIPKQIVEQHEREEAERRMHARQAAEAAILAAQPTYLEVDDVSVFIHKKAGRPDSLRIDYRCGMLFYSEWVFLEGAPFARQRAEQWWARHFREKAPETTAEALNNMFLAAEIKKVTYKIVVKKDGRYDKVVGHVLRRERFLD